ncbi:MAG: NYN domain-containing protein [Erysipelotrichaceae bacterium]
MKKINLGILAHVDSGKTTLNECCLYHGGVIRKMGRVDFKNAYLDSDPLEKSRGITIFSKSATINYKNSSITLVDTPGHRDFLGEMERTLQVLDLIVLVVSALDLVQAQTELIFKLAKQYNLPVFLFVNKMDLTSFSKEQILADIDAKLTGNFVDFSNDFDYEQLVLSSDTIYRLYEEKGAITQEDIAKLINNRELYPVYFGSALKDDGVVALLDGIDEFYIEKTYPKEFGLRIYKVAYDQNNTRWCYGKVTGGVLKAKQKLTENEKVDQLCIPSADHFQTVTEVEAGTIVAIKGLQSLASGATLGIEKPLKRENAKAFMQYQLLADDKVDKNLLIRQLEMLQQEDPSINVSYQNETNSIYLYLMGEIQIEIIKAIIKKRSGIDIELTAPKILYKETIASPSIGYGHFEPLRHYSEVHLLLTPLPRDSGIEVENLLENDQLSLTWTNSILSALKKIEHIGVLTGSKLTDVKISLIAAKGHLKHTEGNDFYQAALRAVRNGLKRAESVLLEPYYYFSIKASKKYLSRILYDLENMHCRNMKVDGDQQDAFISGKAPVILLNDYPLILNSLTSSTGKIDLTAAGYDLCHDSEKVIEQYGYDSEKDLANPTGSIFCSHGSSFYVPYDLMEQYIHIKDYQSTATQSDNTAFSNEISQKELDYVFNSMGGRNRKEKKMVKKKPLNQPVSQPKKTEHKPKMLIVDGYNILFSYQKVKPFLQDNLDGARDILINDIASLAGYQGYKTYIIFDAYRLNDNLGKQIKMGDTTVVYTRENQNADSFIEKMVHENIKSYQITVATSDMAVQNMVLGDGAIRMSANQLQQMLMKL